jgi:hypothetical protein
MEGRGRRLAARGELERQVAAHDRTTNMKGATGHQEETDQFCSSWWPVVPFVVNLFLT